tara:strand:- start:437 stop:1168 length:732 start_codon:yes stop_codon:yes gene_type:complete
MFGVGDVVRSIRSGIEGIVLHINGDRAALTMKKVHTRHSSILDVTTGETWTVPLSNLYRPDLRAAHVSHRELVAATFVQRCESFLANAGNSSLFFDAIRRECLIFDRLDVEMSDVWMQNRHVIVECIVNVVLNRLNPFGSILPFVEGETLKTLETLFRIGCLPTTLGAFKKVCVKLGYTADFHEHLFNIFSSDGVFANQAMSSHIFFKLFKQSSRGMCFPSGIWQCHVLPYLGGYHVFIQDKC